MRSEIHTPIRGRPLLALRACVAQPQGLRHETYPSVMPLLVERGLVEARNARGPGRTQPAWFLTAAGRAMIAELGAGETRWDRL